MYVYICHFLNSRELKSARIFIYTGDFENRAYQDENYSVIRQRSYIERDRARHEEKKKKFNDAGAMRHYIYIVLQSPLSSFFYSSLHRRTHARSSLSS